MNPYLQQNIDDQFAKAHAWIANEQRGARTLRDSFQDFAHKVRDFQYDITLGQAGQILDLIALLDQHGQSSNSGKYWMLGALVRKIREVDEPDAGVLSRILIESVSVSLAMIEDKEQFSVVAGRTLFEYFAFHAEKLSDEAFKVLFDNSRVLTRFAGEDESSHNLLFDCSMEYFQSLNPTNHALMSLVSLHVESHEKYIDLEEILLEDSYKKRHLLLALSQIRRAHELGVKIQMHAPDVLFVSGFARRLMQVDQKVGAENASLLEATAKALLEMVTPDQAVPAITNNLFKYPVRSKIVLSAKHDWLLGMFKKPFHEDIGKSLNALRSLNNLGAIEPQVTAFASHVFLSGAQAHHHLAKATLWDNKPYLREWLPHAETMLLGNNPLKGLKATERLVVLDVVKDKALKHHLLQQYKADKGPRLMEELGL
jgi:hypothetical protein